ncbi:hypothetical protein JTB14_033389 [Gonioctena quinquepunctata]|nr:hypothetical protein JTB14_033389 [Gonioctena quinquepunctata]
MWSQIIFSLLVGLALASNTPGWKDNTEYVYKVRGRTLVSFHDISNQYSGILLRATLRIQARPDGKVQGMISDPEYSQIHSLLQSGWNTFIPDSELTWKTLEMSKKPFQMEMKYGVVTDLMVGKDVSNWEANTIKGIMSQFQLQTYDIDAPTSIKSGLQHESAVFTVMEDTVTGNSDTLYEVRPLPKHLLQSKPWEIRLVDYTGDGDVIEIVKHKNYTNSVELPSYFFGFSGMKNWDPATNQMGDFFIRHSMGRAILTGSTRRYTVHNTYTINSIIANPTLTDKQKGSVVSMVNVTLEEMKSRFQIMEEVHEPVRLGNLVSAYEKPFTHSEVREKRPYQTYTEHELGSQRSARQRLRRSIHSLGEETMDDRSEESYKQDVPLMKQAPESPFLPFTMGNKGKSVKYGIDIVKSVEELTEKIADELQDPTRTLEQSSASKFVTLSSLIRIMNEDELRKATNALHTDSDEGMKHYVWVIYRDALAEAGTGPAFLAIQSLIKSNKISGLEASHILATMTKSVRQPTLQYMRAYFELVKSPEVESKWLLNGTALLSYTDLVREVYFDKNYKKQFPTKSFVKFRTEEAMKYVYDTVIPHLTLQLHESISEADTLKIHEYIRALGNLGVPEILPAFEEYLEGRKQASQYQRLLMVVALDKLALLHPKEARDVLFRIYQNPGERQELRVAAVYLLFNAQPSAELIQHMAAYTRLDVHEHVNAAVKSTIESLAEVRGERYHKLRHAAKAARSLLTEKIYGIQFGAMHLKNYIFEELNLRYTQILKSWGSDDEFYPKGIELDLDSRWGGLNYELLHVKALISSVEELVRVGVQQTLRNLQEEEKHEKKARQQQYPWSSQTVASLLNMKPEIREQLEGSIYFGDMGSVFKMLSFDNRTIEKLPELLRNFEEMLSMERNVNYLKLFNRRDFAVSFPTEMGLPFLFTYDAPMILQAKGKVQTTVTPALYNRGKIQYPENVNIKSDMFVTLSSKVQGRLSFSTPFDHQQYSSGFDKHWQIHVPMKGEVRIDTKNHELEIEYTPREIHNNAQLFHYSSWPYTSKNDIMNFDQSQANTQIIVPQEMRSVDSTLGQRDTGLAIRVRIDSERESLESPLFENLFTKQGLEGALLKLLDDASMKYVRMNISHLPHKSSTRMVVMKLRYQSKYNEEAGSRSSESGELSAESVFDKVAAGIKNARVEAFDASLQFRGEKDITYSLAGGFGKSNVDPKSRVGLFYKRASNNQEVNPYEMALVSESVIPNRGGLNLDEALETEPKMNTKVQLRFGSPREKLSKIIAEIEHRRSEGRKQYLIKLPMYLECKHEMRNGNKQLPACANMTMESNLLDHIKLKVRYENLKPGLVEALEHIYKHDDYRHWLTFEAHESQKPLLERDTVMMDARFHPDLKFVNVSLKTESEYAEINDIAVDEMVQVFVTHPVCHSRSQMSSRVLGLATLRPFCVVDQTQISTSNNRTYAADLSKHWTVMLQYLPKLAQRSSLVEHAAERLRSEMYHYVVLVRESTDSEMRKDVKITLSAPETGFEDIDITLTPKPQVTSGSRAGHIGDATVEVNDRESHDVNGGYVQIYALPSGEVKVEVQDAFYVIYDGERVLLTVVNGKFRDDVRGLCGQFNDESPEDFLTPLNCLARDPVKFIRSYEVEGQQGMNARKVLSESKLECIEKHSPMYMDVISEDIMRHRALSYGRTPEKCEHSRTKYFQENGQICFTTKPLLSCNHQCQARGYLTKSVPVHCITKSNVAQLWKTQIDRGLSPDFSSKEEHKKMQMQVPQGCSQ